MLDEKLKMYLPKVSWYSAFKAYLAFSQSLDELERVTRTQGGALLHRAAALSQSQ